MLTSDYHSILVDHLKLLQRPRLLRILDCLDNVYQNLIIKEITVDLEP